MSRSAIAVVGSAQVDSTAGLAATLAVAVARVDGLSCLMVELVPDDSVNRAPTLLASAEARAIENRMRDGGLEAASRGHICSISLTGAQWEEVGPHTLLDMAKPSRVVFSFGTVTPFERMIELEGELAGCVALLDLPEERSLGALIAEEMIGRGVAVKVTGRQPGLVAARRALAGVRPGGGAEQYGERVVSQLPGRRCHDRSEAA